MQKKEKENIVNGAIWKFAERISSQCVGFFLNILLARLLMPEEFGIIAMIHVFIAVANVFVTSGISTSLIQKKDADELDFSTMLYCSLFLSFVVYALVFLCSPFIAKFYGMPILTDVTRVYAVVLILYGYNSIQSAWVSRNMVFKKFFFATFFGTLISGVVGVLLAMLGYGVWAIVFQGLANALVNTIVLKLVIPWRPKLIFSWMRAKKLISYGSKILGADLIGTFFNELQQILVGKIYTAADLALLNRGKSFPQFFTNNIDTTINTVLFPALSNYSDDLKSVKHYVRKSIKMSSYFMFFFMTMLIVVAAPMIELLLTERWLDCVPYLQLVCLANMFGTVSTANMQAIKAVGHSGTLLKLEFVKKPIYLSLILIAVFISVKAVAITYPIYAICSSLINMYPNKKTLDYGYIEQMKDLFPSVLLGTVMFLCVYPCNYLDVSCGLRVAIEMLSCAIIYGLLSVIFKVESYRLFRDVVKMKLGLK